MVCIKPEAHWAATGAHRHADWQDSWSGMVRGLCGTPDNIRLSPAEQERLNNDFTTGRKYGGASCNHTRPFNFRDSHRLCGQEQHYQNSVGKPQRRRWHKLRDEVVFRPDYPAKRRYRRLCRKRERRTAKNTKPGEKKHTASKTGRVIYRPGDRKP